MGKTVHRTKQLVHVSLSVLIDKYEELRHPISLHLLPLEGSPILTDLAISVLSDSSQVASVQRAKD